LAGSCFHKAAAELHLVVNRKDRSGKNVFERLPGIGQYPGLLTVSRPLPTGGYLEQADGTAWMALFCQNMLEIAGHLARRDPPTWEWPASS